jgi:hypothetical protein
MNKKKWIIVSLIIYLSNYVGITTLRIINTIERTVKEDVLRSILYDLESGFQFATISWIMSMICIVWILLDKRLYKKLRTRISAALSIFVLLLVYFLTIVVWLNSLEIMETSDGFGFFLFGMAFYCKLFLYHLFFLGCTMVKKVRAKKNVANNN